MPSMYSSGSVELNSPANPVYQMVICFLEQVIQTNYLTEMTRFLATPDAFLNSWTDGWDEWLLYLIGFSVCASIGIFLFVAMFFICCCSCCCCSNNSKSKKKKKKKTKDKHPEKSDFSRCSCVSCSVIMLVVVTGMIISIVPMFTMNNRINTELSEGVWVKMNQSIDTAYLFLVTAVEDIDDVLYDGYVDTETKVFDVLYALPAESLQVLESNTGLGTAARGIVAFTRQLPDLQSNLTVADNLTQTLQSQQEGLQSDLDSLISDITNSGNCEGTSSSSVCDDVKNITVVVDFYQINLTTAVNMVDYTVNSAFTDLVRNISLEVMRIGRDLNATIIPAIDSAANQSQAVKDKITEAITNLNASVTSLEVDEAKETITTIQNDDIYVMAITITYWTTFGLLVVLAVITALFILGLILGTILPYSKGSSSCCRKSAGARWLQSGSGLVFSFYWLYMLLLVVLFVGGGLIHTEACRHVTKVEKAESFAVLAIFDNWINQTLYGETGYNIPILPFDTYRLCNNNSAIYTALHLEEEWNLTHMALDAQKEINDAFDEIKNTELTIHPVDLTNPTVDQVLRGLDLVFGPNGLNFSAIVYYLDRSIVEPNLTKIIEDLNSANMSSYADALQDILDTVLVMEGDKQALIGHLKIVDSIVTAVSFLGTAQTFNSSEAVINENGTALVSDFVNKTADSTEAMIVDFVLDSTYAVENDVAQCFQLYTAVEQTADSACVYFLYSVNGLWFCLGSCIFFLLIGVLATPTLVKMYRSTGPNPKTTKAHAADMGPANSDTISYPPLSSKAQEAAVYAVVSDQGPPLKMQPQGPISTISANPVHPVSANPGQQISAISTGQVTTEFSSADHHLAAGVAIAGTTVAVVEMAGHDKGRERSNGQVANSNVDARSRYPIVNQNVPQHSNNISMISTPNGISSTNAQYNSPPSYNPGWWKSVAVMSEPFVFPRQKVGASQIHPRSQAAAAADEPLYSEVYRAPYSYKNQAYEPPRDY